jgi:uroporphyrinogen-III decarboxylase
MNQAKWKVIRQCARREDPGRVPVALIVDSPWIPGYLGLSTLDYLFDPDTWLKANLQIERDFPDLIFLPGFWAEAGMGAEPSGFGCKVSFFADKTPQVAPIISSFDELDRITEPNPRADGLMPYLLTLYRKAEPRLADAGACIKVVAARGPLTVAAHLMGVTEFVMGLKLEPEKAHRLLRITTALVKNWLDAQAGALKEAEGILVLDDITGFVSPKDFQEFALPYLQDIFRAFPNAVRIFHNDTNNAVPYRFLREIPVDIFNFTHLQNIAKVRELAGPDVCLMGNVPPLEALAQGTPEEVAAAARACVAANGGRKGLLLSAGGGASPGTPGANVRALAAAVKDM